MDEKNAVNTTDSAAGQTVVVDDNEVRISALEAEKAKLEGERDNWKTAALKYKDRAKGDLSSEEDEERMEHIAKKALAESRLADIAREQQTIIERALKENKELKLGLLNKGGVPAAIGTHSESTAVKDTLITPEQMSYFRAPKPDGLGWNDKDIERYKAKIRGGR